MAAHKTKPFEREKLRAQIADLRLRGFRPYEIAEHVGLRRQTVDYHLGVIEQRWRASAVAALEGHRARLLAASEQRKRELSDAWEQSKRQRTSTTTRWRKVPAASTVDVDEFPSAEIAAERVEREEQVRLDERDPDWHFLDAVRREDELQAKLLGLLGEAPWTAGCDEPVRRVVVYMERGRLPSDDDEALPPGDGPVIDVGSPSQGT